jgi:hypothetical protein
MAQAERLKVAKKEEAMKKMKKKEVNKPVVEPPVPAVTKTYV